MSDLLPALAIDPGAKGAFVWGTSLTDVHYRIMPKNPVEVCDLFSEIHDAYDGNLRGYLEKITGYMAGVGKKGDDDGDSSPGVSPKAMFSFGKNVGALEFGFSAFDIPLTEVTPQAWMRACKVPLGVKSIMGPKQWKNHLKDEARKKFPKLSSKDVTLTTADALLIYYAAITNKI